MSIHINKYVLASGLLLLLPTLCPNRLSAFLWGIALTLGPFVYLTGFTRLNEEETFEPKPLKCGRSHALMPPSAVPIPFPDSPEISGLIREMVDKIVNDFIIHWFSKIDGNATEAAFPASVKSVLIEAIVRLSKLLKTQDVIQSIIYQLVLLITNHINVFYMARDTVLCSTPPDTSRRIKEAYDLRIAIEYNRIQKLHRALSLKPGRLQSDVKKYSELISRDLLTALIDEGNLASPLVSTLGRDILAHNILGPSIIKLHHADTWNLMLISISKKILRERNQVDSVRRMLRRELKEYDRKPGRDTADGQATSAEGLDMDDFDYNLNINCSGKEFESYIRNLSLVNSMSDLRAIQFALIMKLVHLEKSKDLKQKGISSYRKRIKLSMDLIEAKLNYNNGTNKRDRTKSRSLCSDVLNDRELFLKFEEITGKIPFTAIVHNSTCVSHFNDFLKAKGDEASLTFLNYLKFVDVIKDPLEDANMETLTVTNSQSTLSSLTELADLYLKGKKLEYMKSLDAGLVINILLFIHNKDLPIMNNEGIPLARKSMLLLQSQAEAVLEQKYFEDFKKSSSFFRMLSSPDFIDTDIYSNYFVPYRESDEEDTTHDIAQTPMQNSIESNLHTPRTKNQTFDPIRVFSSAKINQELDNIVGGKNNSNNSKNSSDSARSGATRSTPPLIIRAASNKNQETLLNRGISNGSPKKVNSDGDLFKDGNNQKSFGVSLQLKRKSWLLKNKRNMKSIGFDEDLSHLLDHQVTSNPNIHETAPHSNIRFNLEEEIGKLDYDIEQIGTELDLLKYLILKADLTNNQSRLRLLKRSRKILRKELRTKELQRQRYIVQRNANSLYNRTTISVKSYLVETEASSFRDITYYIIHVTHSSDESSSSWEVPRRYTEFYALHSYLKKTYKELVSDIIRRELFPKKVSMSLKYHLPGTYLYERRKYKFEIYLKELLKIEEICKDEHFRQFLTSSENFFINKGDHVNSVSPTKGTQAAPLISGYLDIEETEDSDDMTRSEIHPTGSSFIDRFSSEDTLITQSSESTGSGPGKKQNALSLDGDGERQTESASVVVRDLGRNGITTMSRDVVEPVVTTKPTVGEGKDMKSISPANQEDVSFVEPICDLFIAIFSTTKKRSVSRGFDGNQRPNYWLRGGAIVMVLQQLFGNTIDKYMRESILKLESKEKIHEILIDLKTILWGPNGYFERQKKLKDSGAVPHVRTTLEMRSSSAEAKVLIEMVFIELCGKVVGLHHSREAASKIHEILQNPYLNMSLLLEILDLILRSVFSVDHGAVDQE